jgi:molybdopterin converting factor small subunit
MKLLLFAQLRTLVGQPDIDLTEWLDSCNEGGNVESVRAVDNRGPTLGELREFLRNRFPELERWLDVGVSTFAVNQCLQVDESYRILSRDELALLPPMTGG